MSLQVTASALPILHECAWPFQPGVVLPKDEGSPEATLGTTVHALIAALVEKRMGDYARGFGELQGEDYYTIADHARAFEEFWSGRPAGAAEVTVAWSRTTRKARILGQHLNRDYSAATPDEVVGTADYVVEYPDNEGKLHLLVGDVKTGWADHVAPVSENRQVRFLAMAIARAMGYGEVELEISYVRPGKVWAEHTNMDELEMMAVEEQLLAAMADGRSKDAVAGPHCQFCMGRGVCPATTQGMMARVAPGLDKVKWSAIIEDDEHASKMAYFLPGLKKAVEAVNDALKARVRANGPIILPDGRVYRIVTMKKKSMDYTALKNALADRLSEFESEIEIEQFRVVKR